MHPHRLYSQPAPCSVGVGTFGAVEKVFAPLIVSVSAQMHHRVVVRLRRQRRIHILQRNRLPRHPNSWRRPHRRQVRRRRRRHHPVFRPHLRPVQSGRRRCSTTPTGVAPAFGTSATLSAPLVPSAVFVIPGATAAPLAVMNGGQVMIRLPCAWLPSAAYTVSATVVVAGPLCANCGLRLPALPTGSSSLPANNKAAP